MRNQDFINRLKQELPYWISKGWIESQYQAAILASVDKENNPQNQINPKSHTTQNNPDKWSFKPNFFVFSFLGISLLAVGIILFFASHWQAIPKIAKLALLFGSMWASYALAGFLLLRTNTQSPIHWFGHLLLFLATVLFGSNIFLIAQIYHIDAHFPNGLLLWSLGALLVAVLLNQQSCLIMSLILILIWSVTESQFFLRSIHWMFVPVFFINIIPIIKKNWELSWHVSLIILILWLSNNILWLNYPYNTDNQTNYFAYYFGLCSLGSFSIWILSVLRIMSGSQATARYVTLQHYALFFFLLNLFYLSFPSAIEGLRPLATLEVTLTGFLILLSLVLYILFYKTVNNIPERLQFIGGLELITLSLLLALNHFGVNHSWIAVGFNMLFVCCVLWFISLGFELKDKIYINLAFIFFAFFVIGRYFDVFWDLLNRSFFFMGGGLILIIGSYLLEKKRRSITRGIQ